MVYCSQQQQLHSTFYEMENMKKKAKKPNGKWKIKTIEIYCIYIKSKYENVENCWH